MCFKPVFETKNGRHNDDCTVGIYNQNIIIVNLDRCVSIENTLSRKKTIARRSERVRRWKVIGAERAAKSEIKNERKIGIKKKT